MRNKSREGLLSELVQTRFFQLLIGNGAAIARSEDSETESKKPSKSKSTVKQSLGSQIVDVLIFGIFCAIAPFILVLRTLSVFIGDRYWVKFSLGVITGISSLAIVALLLKKLMLN